MASTFTFEGIRSAPSKKISSLANPRLYKWKSPICELTRPTENALFQEKYTLNMGNEHIILEVYKEGHLIIYLEYYAVDDAWTQAVPFFKKAGEDLMARATRGVFDLKKKVLAEYFWVVRSSSN